MKLAIQKCTNANLSPIEESNDEICHSEEFSPIYKSENLSPISEKVLLKNRINSNKRIMFFSDNLMDVNSSSNKTKKNIIGVDSKLNHKANMNSKKYK